MKNKNSAAFGYFEIFAAGALWGFIGFFTGKMGAAGATSALTSTLRLACGALVIIPLTALKSGIKAFKVSKREFICLLAIAVFSEALFNLCYTASIARVGVACGAVLLYTSPIFVCIMSAMVFKEEIDGRKKLAILINFLGCVLTVTGGKFAGINFDALGVLLGVAAGFLYATITIFGKFVSEVDSFVVTSYSFGIAALLIIVFTGSLGDFALVQQPGKVVLLGVCYGVFSTIMPYLLYFDGLKKPVEASKVPVAASVETVVAAVSGALLMSEELTLAKWLGVALVMLSIAIMNIKKRKAQ